MFCLKRSLRCHGLRSMMRSSSSTTTKFHLKTLEERQDALNLSKEQLAAFTSGGLSLHKADAMVENVVGTFALPLGIVPQLMLNNTMYQVPMVTEEPSVVAAASAMCKLISQHGGFTGSSTRPVMTAQLQLHGIPSSELSSVVATLNAESNKRELINHANEFCTSMVKRGGGVQDIEFTIVSPRGGNTGADRPSSLVALLHVDCQDSMGANLVDGISEGLTPFLMDRVRSIIINKNNNNNAPLLRPGLRILTNLCLQRTTKVSFQLPVQYMGWKGTSGEDVALKLMDAYYLAVDDIFRAVTHNKGAMNGIDAVCVATGQDWRAVEASMHGFQAYKGVYGPFSTFSLANGMFCGEIETPISVGTVGGSVKVHDAVVGCLELLGKPDSQTLSQIILSVGLAQNLAAMRALATEGIQKGHMKLHHRKEEKLKL